MRFHHRNFIIEAIWAYCNLTRISCDQSQWREDDSVSFRLCHSAILLSPSVGYKREEMICHKSSANEHVLDGTQLVVTRRKSTAIEREKYPKATVNNDTKMPKEIILNIYIGIIVLCICCYYNRYIHTTHRHYHAVYQSTNPKSTGIPSVTGMNCRLLVNVYWCPKLSHQRETRHCHLDHRTTQNLDRAHSVVEAWD